MRFEPHSNSKANGVKAEVGVGCRLKLKLHAAEAGGVFALI